MTVMGLYRSLKIYFGDLIWRFNLKIQFTTTKGLSVYCQWNQLLQPKYDAQTNYINFPHPLQLIQATVETLCKSLRIATFDCNTKWKSL